jgi:hypothetical protein
MLATTKASKVSNRKRPSHKEEARLKAALKILSLSKGYPGVMLRIMLETPFLPNEVSVDIPYQRHDDDGQIGTITAGVDGDGTAWIRTATDPQDRTIAHRFGIFSSGESPRVRNAVIFLTAAIALDNSERPQEAKP